MKRTFHGTVGYTRRDGAVQLYANQLSAIVFAWYAHFRDIFGVRCRKHTSGELDLTLRLIDTPMPWQDWEWSDGEEYQSDRLVVDYSLRWLRFSAFKSYGTGKRQVLACCPDEFGKIFPGLGAAIGIGNACEVEITVTARRRGHG